MHEVELESGSKHNIRIVSPQKGINLCIPKGQLVAVIGPVGSGKSS